MTTVSNYGISDRRPVNTTGIASEDGLIEEPIPTYPIPFPSLFSEWAKRNLHPVQTSYYTAWIRNDDSEEWIRLLLENEADTPLKRAARKAFYDRFSEDDDIDFLDDHPEEIETIKAEYVSVKQAHNPSFVPPERALVEGNFFQKNNSLILKIILVALGVLCSLTVCLALGVFRRFRP